MSDPSSVTPSKDKLLDVAKTYARNALTRREMTSDQLRRRMAARLARRFPSPQFELKADVIEEVISEVEALCRSYSMIDDNAFSRRRASAGVRAGKSKWSTTMALRAKGIDSETASDCLSEYDDLVAALHFLRKKKMGPFAEREEGHDRRQRVMGAFLRCGFSSSLWNRTGAMSIDEAEERMSTVRL